MRKAILPSSNPRMFLNLACEAQIKTSWRCKMIVDQSASLDSNGASERSPPEVLSAEMKQVEALNWKVELKHGALRLVGLPSLCARGRSSIA